MLIFMAEAGYYTHFDYFKILELARVIYFATLDDEAMTTLAASQGDAAHAPGLPLYFHT